MALTNSNCVKSSIETQSYKVVNIHAREIPGGKFLSRIIHALNPNLGETSGDIQSEISTLALKNGEKLEIFHRRILRLQQEINLYGENFSSTRLLFHYMMELLKRDKLKAIVPNMKYLIKFLDNNRNQLYTEGERFMDSIVI